MSIIYDALKKAANNTKNDLLISISNSRVKSKGIISSPKKSIKKRNVLILSTSLILLSSGIFALSSKSFLNKEITAKHLTKIEKNEITTSDCSQQNPADNQMDEPLSLLASKCTINGIVYQEGSSSAIINNKVYNIGDCFENAKIVNIKENGIVFEADGHEEEISIE